MHFISSIVVACTTSCNANYNESIHTKSAKFIINYIFGPPMMKPKNHTKKFPTYTFWSCTLLGVIYSSCMFTNMFTNMFMISSTILLNTLILQSIEINLRFGAEGENVVEQWNQVPKFFFEFAIAQKFFRISYCTYYISSVTLLGYHKR